ALQSMQQAIPNRRGRRLMKTEGPSLPALVSALRARGETARVSGSAAVAIVILLSLRIVTACCDSKFFRVWHEYFPILSKDLQFLCNSYNLKQTIFFCVQRICVASDGKEDRPN